MFSITLAPFWVYRGVSWCAARVHAVPRRSVAAAWIVYGVCLIGALGSGLGSTESTPSPPPIRLIEMRSDAGVQVAAEAVQEAAAEIVSEVPPAEEPLLNAMLPKANILIDSTAAYVLDETCGRVLYSKNEDRQVAPASLTKMMTALVAADHVGDLDQVVSTVTSAKELKRKTGSSVMGLEPGMHLTMRDLLYGLMLPSGNDAAIEIARAVAGDVDAFSAMMNEKAAQLGLTSTHFDNPHGLDSAGLRSTARDLVVLGQAMMANPLLAEISRAGTYRVEDIELKNGNKMIAEYQGTYGVKIGYTGDASHTIVVAAERDGHRVYASVLGSEVPYVDATALLDWAFGPGRIAC